MFNEGSSATDYVTDVTDVTPIRNKEEEVWILDCIILGLKHRCWETGFFTLIFDSNP